MDELTKLAIKYGSDRHPGSKHSYTPFYNELFKDKKFAIRKILEIGVGEGSGLKMWRDFFPKAFIFGIDNDPGRVFTDDRIEVFNCDQSSEKGLHDLIKKIGDDIDFVVDDGSHKPIHQVFTCLTLMPRLPKNAIYVIEDVFDFSIVKELTSYHLEIPALQRWRKRYDDYLVVVRHG